MDLEVWYTCKWALGQFGNAHCWFGVRESSVLPELVERPQGDNLELLVLRQAQHER